MDVSHGFDFDQRFFELFVDAGWQLLHHLVATYLNLSQSGVCQDKFIR